jgi:galactokinase
MSKLRAGTSGDAAVMAQQRGRTTVLASVPGRICLAGESLDWMTGGTSVTAAIPLHTRMSAWRADGSDALALTSGAPLYRTRLIPAAQAAAAVYDQDDLDHMQAAARVTLPSAADLAGLVLTANTDLPVGAGVSSSAALTLAVVAALRDGMAPDLLRACSLARRAEADDLHTGAGWMDFLACAYGGVNLISAGRSPSAHLITGSLGLPVVLIDTRQRRSTATVLAAKRERFRSGDRAILTYIRETAALTASLAQVLGQPQPDYQQAGVLITAAHALLRDQVACSTALIDECAIRVLRAGAYGAKLSGSGHGGCLFALVPDDAVAAVLASIATLPVHAIALPRSDATGMTCTPPGPIRRGAARPA